MARKSVAGPTAPPALGPYSPLVSVGDLLFVSAQSGIDPATNKLPPGGFEAECRQAFLNLQDALRSAGSDFFDVVKVGILYVKHEYLATINAVYAESFAIDPPARTAAIVGLAGGRNIAIDAIAARGSGSPDTHATARGRSRKETT
jgi:2-iminobutanoate/2-iminopropanoate deaminase